MNAAARLVDRRFMVISWTNANLLQNWPMMVLLLALLLSSLATVYTAHYRRNVHAEYRHQEQLHDSLRATQSQLLLERSTLLTQARLQYLAETKLDMIMPDHKHVTMMKV